MQGSILNHQSVDNPYAFTYDNAMTNTYILTASEARQNLYQILKRIGLGTDQYIIKPKNSAPVVILNLEEYESLLETALILTDPEAIDQIKTGLNQARSSQGVKLV